MRRREFIRILLGSAALGHWPVRLARAGVAPGQTPRRLMVILLRGGIDGLNVVAPYRDPDYYLARPHIALPPPGQDGVLDLDGRFGLHPALNALMPFWAKRQLAFVQACGSPDPTRSHFDAQDYAESGAPGDKTIPDGWMNRLLGCLPDGVSPVKAINAGATVPRILQGPLPVANLALGPANVRALAVAEPPKVEFFAPLYAGDAALDQAFREGLAARRRIQADLDREMREADRDAVPPHGFAGQAHQLGRLIDTDPEIRLAFLSVGGWDTHIHQGAVTGQLANRLEALGAGLSALAEGLGGAFAHTVIVIQSEFGRTMRENGNGGTDHGHGNVMWLLGGPVQGGQVWGRWPGLGSADLYEGRDLAVTTDFRAVYSSVLRAHCGLDAEALGRVFPRFTDRAEPLPLMRKA